MKNILFIFLFVVSFLYPINIYASSEDSQSLCLKILSEQEGIPNLSNVNIGGKIHNIVNYDQELVLGRDENGELNGETDKYPGFIQGAVVNNSRSTRPDSGTDMDGKFFWGKRNNIGTVMASDYWVFSNFVNLGSNTGFEFPLISTRPGEIRDLEDQGDDWGIMSDEIVWTQFILKDGNLDLLNCGYMETSPAFGKTEGDLNQTNYLANRLGEASFEWINSGINKGGKKFNVAKVGVNGLDFDEDDLLRQDVVAVFYDNGSDYFNQYSTFQFQIDAMTNADLSMEGMLDTMEKYRDLLREKTCYKLVHDASTLPDFCGGSFKDKVAYINNSDSLFTDIIDFLVPSVHAQLTIPDDVSEELQSHQDSASITMMGLEYDYYKMITNLENENLKNYFLNVINPNSKAIIQHRLDKGENVSYNDEVFLNSDFSTEEIRENIVYVLDNYHSKGEINTEEIQYLDPSFGDFVIPYPDVRHRDKVVPGSFYENQINAFKRKYKDEYEELMAKKNELESEFLDSISDLNMERELLRSKSDLSNEELQKLQELEDEILDRRMEFNASIDEFESERISEFMSDSSLVSDTQSRVLSEEGSVSKKSNNTYIFMIILFFASIVLIIGAFRMLKK
ncbi:hypothetical protein [Candidatus Vampirococcus lugosii]|uniref:Uncharacterized protein n=1 Tax=Candidatus Vampirococcus lugosii TaxID=2789015 RepID=A0ABS5QMV0_9BACT|nr:hypothetical protein [Candidatus Vampirococcus lugosii]MBS8122545.1 hypothetical protein [Candidatus Vampirococcus lugosii]